MPSMCSRGVDAIFLAARVRKSHSGLAFAVFAHRNDPEPGPEWTPYEILTTPSPFLIPLAACRWQGPVHCGCL